MLRRELLVVSALLVVYLATRLWRLGALPMFVDEGMYLTWSLQALHARNVLDTLVSVTDGKQPLFPWLMAPLLALLPDRLIAARLTSVAAGGVSLLATYWLARRLYGRELAALAGALYVAAPLTFFYDRIALYDGLIACCGLLCLAASVWWLSRPALSRTGLLGLVMGAALLTKVSAFVLVISAPIAALCLLPENRRVWWRVAGAYALGALIFAGLLLHPQARMLFDGAGRYAFTARELAQWPWRTWQQNAAGLATSLAGYLPAPLWCFYAAGLALPLVTRDRRDATLAGWCLVLLGSTLLVNRVFYFRYYVPGAVAGLLLCARALWLTGAGVEHAFNRLRTPWSCWFHRDFGLRTSDFRLGFVLLCCAVAPSASLLWALWHDPRFAALPAGPHGDRQQYVLSQEAGWEADRVAGFLRAQATAQDIVVLLTPLNANMRAWVGSQLLDLPHARVVLRTLDQTPLEQIISLEPESDVRRFALSGGAVYVAVSEWSGSPNAQPLVEDEHQPATLVADYPRPDMPWRQRVYQLHFPREIEQQRFETPPTFGEHIALLGYDLEPPAPAAGATQSVTLYWRTDRRLVSPYVVFLHLVSKGSDADKRAQHDGEPNGGRSPTTRWQPGAVVEDASELTLPAATECGSYRLLVGLYDRVTLQRLPAAGNGLPIADDAVQLQTVEPAGCPMAAPRD